MTLTMNLDTAKVIYRNLRSSYTLPDDQKAVYSFVRELEHLIFQEEQDMKAANESKRNVDK